MARLHEALPRDLYDAFAACCTAATAAAAIHRDAENFMKFHAKDGQPIPPTTATAIFASSVVTLRDKLRRAYEAFDLVESDLYIADGETCAHADAICYSQQVHSAVILIPDLLKVGFDPDVVGQQISKFWVSVWASLCSIKPIDLWQLGEKCKKEAASAAFRRKAETPPPPPPESAYLDLAVDVERHEVQRNGYANKRVNLSGPVAWPMFLALFKAKGTALSRQQLSKLPGEGQAARRTAKARLNDKLKELGVVIPNDEWRIVDVSQA